MSQVDPDLPPPRSVVAWALGLLAVLLVLGVALIVGSVVLGGGDDDGPPPASVRKTTSPSTEPSAATTSPSVTPSDAGRPTAAELTGFVNAYLATVTTDPAKAWSELSPAFQAASGGYQSYVGFWGKVQTATPSKVFADEEAGTVGYVVSYAYRDGRTGADQTRLHLARSGDGSLQITGEG